MTYKVLERIWKNFSSSSCDWPDDGLILFSKSYIYWVCWLNNIQLYNIILLFFFSHFKCCLCILFCRIPNEVFGFLYIFFFLYSFNFIGGNWWECSFRTSCMLVKICGSLLVPCIFFANQIEQDVSYGTGCFSSTYYS